MWHPWEPLAHLDTPLLLDVICMNSKVWIDCDRSSWKHLSFKHTPRLLWSRLWQFNLSVVKQFNAPSLSVTLDYCTSHWRDIILFYFLSLSVRYCLFVFCAVFLRHLSALRSPELRPSQITQEAIWEGNMNLLKQSQDLSASPTVQDELGTIGNSATENEFELNTCFPWTVADFRIQSLSYTEIHNVTYMS